MSTEYEQPTIKVHKPIVYYPEGHKLTPAQQQQVDAGEVICKRGEPEDGNMRNTTIESGAAREALRQVNLNYAKLCISLKPGKRLGQVHVCVQYEAAKGERNSCIEGQNDLAIAVSEWMRDVLGEANGQWDVQIEAVPCEKADVPNNAPAVARTVERRVVVGPDPTQSSNSGPAPRPERQVRHAPEGGRS